MLVSGSDPGPHLDAVLPSSVAAMAGKPNRLGLPRIRAAIVVLVDGLGAAALKERSGHARTLASRMGSKDVIETGAPTTTAAALATLTTGTLPGRHGIVGYSALDPVADRVVNQLTGWGGTVDPATWQRMPTVFETATGVRSVAVGPARFASSGFSAAILRGAEYVGAEDIQERFDTALRVVGKSGSTLVYLYVPELDMAAHAVGLASDRWITALEEVDSALADALRRLRPDTALLVTADHGLIDVPAERHVLIDEWDGFDAVRHVGGDPRLVHLYLDPGASTEDRDALAARWAEDEAPRGRVLTRDQAIADDWFGPVDPEVAPRIGDILIEARAEIAYYDGGGPSSPRSMVGQHGAWSDKERRVPLLRFGAAQR
ncbi:alkaline phosphatase family protein [Naasia lichenicola]|uniref:Alkaline phosphatase family protein n=2 Tax=Naasia lichenicola TaxID=2565933 RepID=A0A4S4FT21_9MICO|nr:alkaline phosphatase family protein [Naasia lichenicola]